MPPPHPHQRPQPSSYPHNPAQHPLLKLRRLLFVTAILGIALSLLSILFLSTLDVSSYQIPPFLLAVILLLLSLLVVCIDLHTYTSRQQRQTLNGLRISPYHVPQTQASSNENTNRHAALNLPASSSSPPLESLAWPTKALLTTDLVLAFLLQWLFWGTFTQIVYGSWPWNYYGGGTGMIESYANLANLVASVCHGVAFWKGVVARKRAAWERERERRDLEAGWVCVGCGAARDGGEGTQEQRVDEEEEAERGEVGGADEDEGKRPGFGGLRFPRWATGLRGKGNGDTKSGEVVGERHEGGEVEPAATDPLLSTPDESGTEIGAVSTSEGGYGTLGRSVESAESVPETVVRKKDKGKKRLIDVE